MKTERRIKIVLTFFLCFIMPVAFVACGGGSTSPSAVGTSSLSVGTNPSGVAIDASRNVWVANYGSNNVTQLNSSGTVLGTFGVGENPQSLAIDSSGNVWVTNYGTTAVPGTTITELSPTGTLLNTFSVQNNPGGIAIDSVGNIWVANFGSNTVTFVEGVAKGPEFFPYSGPMWPWTSVRISSVNPHSCNKLKCVM